MELTSKLVWKEKIEVACRKDSRQAEANIREKLGKKNRKGAN